MSIFEGSCVALITPFQNGKINFTALEELIERQIAGKTDAILVNGTTGEPSTMTHEEKLSVIDFTVKTVNKRVPVIAGTGSNCTATAIELSKSAEDLGADALLQVTPYYNKCSQEGLFRHFCAVADATALPIILYNIPSRTGVNILPETLKRLSAHEKIVAVKEASANISQITLAAQLTQGALDLYSGNDDHTIPIMSLGAKGVISVAANVIPTKIHDLAQNYLTGKIAQALALQFEVNPLVAALFMDVNPIPVKTALNMMGLNAGELRLPLCEMSEEKNQILRSVLEQYNLL